MVKIVINLPDEVYNSLLKKQRIYGLLDLEYFIMHGTPLPKGHGRLIDENELCEGRVSNDPVVIAAKCATTIIEADKEEYMLDAHKMAITALEQTKWIPVTKRLPEVEFGESDSVLVCFENKTQDVLYFNGGNWCYPTGETYISVNHKNGWHNKVVAWMPLPEPYKSDKEGEQK